jgi:hypothetical protein
MLVIVAGVVQLGGAEEFRPHTEDPHTEEEEAIPCRYSGTGGR